MYLKRLEIQGFKSFANKVEINFESGITGIVGPNGSGKSNISDAIRWVLGEQSAKSLRGGRMEDVIFAGTDNKKPLGMAEVSITLDNNSKTLPIEYKEVTITRRVYRSGESEYYLNKSLCRLKDIRDLLMDTGIGKDGYSIVGQGKIDEILSSRPEDRRQIFEEAAGIVKYRTRKDEAEKKLSSTKENLLRILDIIHELEKQLKPLERQKIKAEKFKELRKNLLSLEVNLFIREIDKLDNELRVLDQQMGLVEKSIKEEKGERDLYVSQLEEIGLLLKKNKQQISDKQDKYYGKEKYMEKLEGQINLEKERLANYNLNIRNGELEIVTIIEGQNRVQLGLEEDLKKLEKINEQIARIKEGIREKNLKYREVDGLILDMDREIEGLKSSIIDRLNEISDKKSQANSLKTLVDTMQERREEISRDYKNYGDRLLDKEREFSLLNKDLDRLKKYRQGLENNIIDRSKKEEGLRKKMEELSREIKQVENTIRTKETRKSLIEGMEREREGFNRGVRNILKACAKDRKLAEGVHGAVADLIRVPQGLELAMEIGLGPALQYIVSEDERVGQKLIDYLRDHNLGRVTIYPLTTIRPRHINKGELKIIKGLENVRLALDIVDFDHKFENIFSNLLSRLLIVEDLDRGIEVARLLNHKFKIVTINGDLLNIGGSLTGGSIHNKGTSILGRRGELDGLIKEIARSKEGLKEKTHLYHQFEEEVENLLADIGRLNSDLQENKIQLATLNSSMDQSVKDKEGLENLYKYATNEIRQIDDTERETLAQYKILEGQIRELELEIQNTKATIGHREGQLAKSKEELNKLNNILTQDKVELATSQGQKETLLQRIKNLQETMEANEIGLKNKNIQIEENTRASKEAGDKIKSLKKERELCLLSLKKYREELKEDEDYRELYEDKELEIEKLLKGSEGLLKELETSLYKLDVRKSKLEMQQENYYTRLREEYDLTYNEALEIKKEITNMANTNREIKLLKKQIRDLGNINLDSIDEYGRIKDRYDFLKEQEEDLSQAKASLIDLIKSMEKTMEDQFIGQFEIIRENFKKVFARLFAGGKADLILEDRENILQSGIDIVAQPPGKKLQTISLLSGGEKALTAISLLFGILLTKPSPFCILDEIEAALDESNVYRYARLLEELSERTQFIVVTHRKGTMESARVLYGVTMEDEGISTLVSVKLTDKEGAHIYTSA